MIVSVCLLTILISILITYNNYQNNRNTLFLGFVFFLSGLYGLSHYFVIFSDSVVLKAVFYNHPTPLFLLIGPLCYFYVRSTLRDNPRLNKYDWLHFIPALIQAIGIMPWILKPWTEKLAIADELTRSIDQLTKIDVNLFFPTGVFMILRPFSVLTYGAVCLNMILRFEPSRERQYQIPSSQFRRSHAWMMIFVICIQLISVLLLIMTIAGLGASPSTALYQLKPIHFSFALLYSLLALSILFYPEVLYGMPRTIPMMNGKTHIHKHLNKDDTTSNTNNSEHEWDDLAMRISKYMKDEKPFCNPTFSIADLSRGLKTPRNHIHYCLNEIMKIKFTEFRMYNRIEYAKTLLAEGKSKDYTIEAIAKESGFNSKTSFYAAFRQQTGQTPAEFVELLENSIN